MSNPDVNSLEFITEDPIYAAMANSAGTRCCEAYKRGRKASLANGTTEFTAKERGKEAFCKVIPQLTGPQNIRDFIACVTYGILIEAISESTATKLLYAEQVAQNSLPKQSNRALKFI